MTVLAAIQFRPRLARGPADVADNFRRAVPLLESAARLGSELVVLPELCFTGNAFLGREEAAMVAEPAGGRTYEMVREAAIRTDSHVAYGFVEDGGTCMFNSAALVAPNGDLLMVSRKSNLVGCDHFWASPSPEPPPIVPCPIGLVSAVVCRDLRNELPDGASSPACPLCDVPSPYYFNHPCPGCGHRKSREAHAVLDRPGLFEGRKVHVVAGLANWGRGMFPPTAWVDFARENGCILVASNRWGEEVNDGRHGKFVADFHQGGSAIVGPDGRVLIQGLVFSQDCVVAAKVEVIR